MESLHKLRTPALVAVLASVIAIQSGLAHAQDAAMTQRETAVAPEINPPGDIPDDQVFISYASPAGFSIEVPEGWSRTDKETGATFIDKYGAIDVTLEQATTLPTIEGVKSTEVPLILAAGHAAEVTKITEMALPAGKVVAVDYLANSEVSPVTGRKIRLENRRLFYAANGRQAVVTLSAPAGADNVDQWKLMAESFRWGS